MTEKQSSNSSHENRHNDEHVRNEHEKHAERLREQLEKAEKEHTERKVDSEFDVLSEAKELAKESDEKHKVQTSSPAERRRGPLSKKQLDGSFTSQMNHVRNHLSPSSRLFSRFIHAKPVEVVSDFVGSTIARPNALFTGSIVAFLTVTILYFTANHFGFRLSGFETIGAFIIGWLLGVLYDYVSVAFRGRNS